MDKSLIYILDSSILYDQNKELLENILPLSKEEVVDLIISKIDGKDESIFNKFKSRFESLGFRHDSEENQYEKCRVELAQLEEGNQDKGTWNDPMALRSDLLNTEFSYYFEGDKTIFYNRQIQDWSTRAVEWSLLTKKKEYLLSKMEELRKSISRGVGSGTLKDDVPSMNPLQKPVRIETQGTDSKEAKKKIPEKWYALLHMIYIDMKKIPSINNYSSKKEIIASGKANHPINGTGQLFYKEIQIIHGHGIYNYIYKVLKKDFGKWKKTILNITEYKSEVKSWMDTNKM